MQLPKHAQVVIIGGGIAGSSTAYHLTELGWKDVVLLDRKTISGGTSWHAAGLLTQLRNTKTTIEIARYGLELMPELEETDKAMPELDETDKEMPELNDNNK